MAYNAIKKYHKEYFSKLIKFGVPAVFEMMITNLGILLLGMFVGRTDVGDVYASYTLSYNVFNALQSIFNGLLVGITVVLVRHSYREHDRHNGVATAFMTVFGILSALICVALAIFAKEVLTLFYRDAEPHVFANAVILHRFFCITLFLHVVALALNACFRGVGNFKTPTITMVIMSVSSAVFGAVFVLWLKAGMLGIVLTIILSRVISLVYEIFVIFKGKQGLAFSFPKRTDFKEMRDSFSIGVMAFLEQVAIQGAYLILQSILVTVGTAAITGYQSANSVINFIYMISGGFNVALVTACGEYYAERKLRKTKGCAWYFTLVNYLLAGAAGLLCVIFPSQIMSLFLKQGEAHVVATKMLPIYAATLLITTLFQVLPGLFKAIGNTKITFIIAVTGSLVVRLPMAYLFISVLKLGYMGIMYSLIVDFSFRFMLYLILTYRLFRKNVHYHR